MLRRLTIAGLVFSLAAWCAVLARGGEFTSLIAVAAAATADRPTPGPQPTPQPSTACDNCGGTGRLGDGTISVACPVCGGDGRVDSPSSSAPVASAFPSAGVQGTMRPPAAGGVAWVTPEQAAASPLPDYWLLATDDGSCPHCEVLARLLTDGRVVKWSRHFDMVRTDSFNGVKPPAYPVQYWRLDGDWGDADTLLKARHGVRPNYGANDLAWDFARAYREAKRKDDDQRAASLPPDQQPTPWDGVEALFAAVAPQPDDVVLDPGCGADARLLIYAVEAYGVKRAIGIEMNPEIAELARQRVKDSGSGQRIAIINNDSTKLDWQSFGANVGVAYLWPETLAAMRPQIEKLDRFASYAHAVPGLPMQVFDLPGGGKIYVWRKPPSVAQVPITRTFRQTVRLPRGSYCQVCGGRCSNPMAHKLQQQIVGYRTVPATTETASAGHWESRKVCQNGVCRYVRTWVPDR